MAKINYDKQNDRVTDWAVRSEGDLKGKSNALGITHRTNSPSPGPSVPKIKHRLRQSSGVIDVVSFRFPRSLIWPHKGAGKGMGGSKGSVWYDKLGMKRTTDPNSFGKMGTGNRVAKEWFNSVMEADTGVDELATIVAEESADSIVNNILIK
jgi:hypothetical protein